MRSRIKRQESFICYIFITFMLQNVSKFHIFGPLFVTILQCLMQKKIFLMNEVRFYVGLYIYTQELSKSRA